MIERLTPTEREIMEHVSKTGAKNRVLAKKLKKNKNTIDQHMHNIQTKYKKPNATARPSKIVVILKYLNEKKYLEQDASLDNMEEEDDIDEEE